LYGFFSPDMAGQPGAPTACTSEKVTYDAINYSLSRAEPAEVLRRIEHERGLPWLPFEEVKSI
jgi:hypothetical protein